MIEEIKDYCLKNLRKQHFDHIAVGVIDFKTDSFESFEITHNSNLSEKPFTYFDLASVTKPMTLASVKIMHPDFFDSKMNLTLNHRGGLPAWGVLSKKGWRELVSSYDIQKSDVLYSDLSALRTMVEIEKVSKKPLYEICSKFWSKETKSWLDLNEEDYCPPTGYRLREKIRGKVHDPNAYTLEEKISHAGLFSTINGLCESLLNLEKKFHFLGKIEKAFDEKKSEDRFVEGWDTVENRDDTIAGNGCGPKVFGHLGFTGTCVWIDPELRCGHVILSNGTKEYWYDKKGLNEMRQWIGSFVWKFFKNSRS